MAALLFAALAAVVLNPPFSGAEATALDIGPPFVVEVVVEMVEPVDAVLIRPVTIGGELDAVAMVPQDDGS